MNANTQKRYVLTEEQWDKINHARANSWAITYTRVEMARAQKCPDSFAESALVSVQEATKALVGASTTEVSS